MIDEILIDLIIKIRGKVVARIINIRTLPGKTAATTI